jgi:hypothetical protein
MVFEVLRRNIDCNDGNPSLTFSEAQGWRNHAIGPVDVDFQPVSDELRTTVVDVAWVNRQSGQELAMAPELFETWQGQGNWSAIMRGPNRESVGVHYLIGIGDPIECDEGVAGPCYQSYSEGYAYPVRIGDSEDFNVQLVLYPDGTIGGDPGGGGTGGGDTGGGDTGGGDAGGGDTGGGDGEGDGGFGEGDGEGGFGG